MRRMATDLEFFNVGTLVSCKTCLDKEIEGEVLAFDANTRMLILKSDPCNGRTNQNNVHMLNLGYVSDIQVRRESKEKPPDQSQTASTSSSSTRAHEQIDNKNAGKCAEDRRVAQGAVSGTSRQGGAPQISSHRQDCNAQGEGTRA